MTNKVIIKGDFDSATIEADRFMAEVTKDYCLVNLEHETFRIDSKYFRALEIAIELGISMEGDK